MKIIIRVLASFIIIILIIATYKFTVYNMEQERRAGFQEGELFTTQEILQNTIVKKANEFWDSSEKLFIDKAISGVVFNKPVFFFTHDKDFRISMFNCIFNGSYYESIVPGINIKFPMVVELSEDETKTYFETLK